MSKRSILEKKVPEKLRELVDLAYNLWWSWDPDAREMFRILDPPLWHSNHNPIFILRYMTDERLERMANKKSFLDLYHKVMKNFKTEMSKDASHLWWTQTFPEYQTAKIAYLSMEYGIHNSLPIYSGGLGILSGDYLKESSDLGVPIVAVGFLYQEGYFTQKISSTRNGWQEEVFKEYDFDDLPIEEVIDLENRKPLLISVKMKDEVEVYVKVWKVNVGRIKLFLLDSNISENVPWFRDLTDRLYGGGSELRLQQEMILGICSVRLFSKLGTKPSLFHLNEGHCSFSSIERIMQLIVNKGLDFNNALKEVRSQTLFTTHTPVQAGHDVFPFWLINTYFKEAINEIGFENFHSLGTHESSSGREDGFNMTILGIKTAHYTNAVSKLHLEVTNKMFQPLNSELKAKYTNFKPMESITNGVHIASFLSEIYQRMFRMVDDNWLDHQDEPIFWDKILDRYTISDYQIWEYHLAAKRRLFKLIRENARNNQKSGYWNSEIALANGALLDPDVLTVGFARRFATYKRATLLFSDFERLKKLIEDPYRPVQFIFAGKAHPNDDAGKLHIQKIYNYAKNPDFGYRIAFIENYDLKTAKILLQGVDVWLNTPRRYNEASGTSGMKACLNFIPNLSILDGWWVEGYNGLNGWAINPQNIEKNNIASQDWTDVQSLYEILENQIVPLYYDFELENIPFNWIKMMREAVRSTLPFFSARRMLKEYSQNLYVKILSNSS
ncbi:MAG: alpha-glucan family phosphorylase [Candidatus Hodarchaeota archaeon]